MNLQWTTKISSWMDASQEKRCTDEPYQTFSASDPKRWIRKYNLNPSFGVVIFFGGGGIQNLSSFLLEGIPKTQPPSPKLYSVGLFSQIPKNRLNATQKNHRNKQVVSTWVHLQRKKVYGQFQKKNAGISCEKMTFFFFI